MLECRPTRMQGPIHGVEVGACGVMREARNEKPQFDIRLPLLLPERCFFQKDFQTLSRGRDNEVVQLSLSKNLCMYIAAQYICNWSSQRVSTWVKKAIQSGRTTYPTEPTSCLLVLHLCMNAMRMHFTLSHLPYLPFLCRSTTKKNTSHVDSS